VRNPVDGRTWERQPQDEWLLFAEDVERETNLMGGGHQLRLVTLKIGKRSEVDAKPHGRCAITLG
jgi:hypothetical protein